MDLLSFDNFLAAGPTSLQVNPSSAAAHSQTGFRAESIDVGSQRWVCGARCSGPAALATRGEPGPAELLRLTHRWWWLSDCRARGLDHSATVAFPVGVGRLRVVRLEGPATLELGGSWFWAWAGTLPLQSCDMSGTGRVMLSGPRLPVPSEC